MEVLRLSGGGVAGVSCAASRKLEQSSGSRHGGNMCGRSVKREGVRSRDGFLVKAAVDLREEKNCIPAVVGDILHASSLMRKQFAGVSGVPTSLFSPVFAFLAAPANGALAFNYDDIVSDVKDAALAASDENVIDFDARSGVLDFVTANPLAIVLGIAAVMVPAVAFRVFVKPQTFGNVAAAEAFAKLSDKESDAQILDIRAAEDVKTEGTPDVRKLRKRVVQLPYVDHGEEYAVRVLAKFKDAENTTLYILDRFDGSSAVVARLLANSGFKGAYAIKGGAEGNKGWKESELPWLAPKKGFKFNLSSLTNVIKDSAAANADSSLVPTTLGVAAAAGVGLVVFSEAETALQLLGSAALVQLFVKKFLFADDRQKTLKEIQTFLDTKIAPKEIIDELKGIGNVLLLTDEEVKQATENGPAILEETLSTDSPTPSKEPATASGASAAFKGDEPLALEAPGPLEEFNLTSMEGYTASARPTDLPQSTTPLSPYTQYPGLKPPTSPTASNP
ncbi:unnamed protein product [Sphagnum balticum]